MYLEIGKNIEPDPARVLCPPRLPCPEILRLEILAYVSEVLMVLGNLVLFIYGLATALGRDSGLESRNPYGHGPEMDLNGILNG